jgi:hypothetical protein
MSIRSIGANGRTPLSGDGFNEAKVLAKLLPTRGGRHANPHWFALEPDCYFPGRASPAISLQNQGILPTLLMVVVATHNALRFFIRVAHPPWGTRPVSASNFF